MTEADPQTPEEWFARMRSDLAACKPVERPLPAYAIPVQSYEAPLPPEPLELPQGGEEGDWGRPFEEYDPWAEEEPF